MFRSYQRLLLTASILALCVIVLGAYVRLSDAGLGCPDWPGCYGHVGVPQAAPDVAQANQAFPERPVESAKAWKEMIHRYFASTLGLLILVIAFVSIKLRRVDAQHPIKLPLFLVALVIFQGMLGMWTVTLLLKPLVVMAHLLGGLATLACLIWLYVQSIKHRSNERPALLKNAKKLVLGVFAVILLQIALGGWTSTNYAALACLDLPTCHGDWVPEMDFAEGFTLWRGLGVNYEFGVLDSAARTAVHWSHRVWAVVTATVVFISMFLILRVIRDVVIRRVSTLIMAGVLIQFALGLANVFFFLPIQVAVAHNGGAAVLVILMVALLALMSPAISQNKR